jgi:hypothetical protein
MIGVCLKNPEERSLDDLFWNHIYLLVDDDYNLIPSYIPSYYIQHRRIADMALKDYHCGKHYKKKKYTKKIVPEVIPWDVLGIPINIFDGRKYKFVIEENFFSNPKYNTIIDDEIELNKEGKEIKEIIYNNYII